MISCKTAIAIYLGAAFGMAQTINIRGVVKDGADEAISGATVRLEVANISTMTGSDGRFTLTNVTSQLRQNVKGNTMSASPIQLKKGKITITLAEIAPVAICIHDVGGGQIYRNKRIYGSGTHAIPVSVQSAGICLISVTIANEEYTFKSLPFGAFSKGHNAVLGGGTFLAEQAQAVAAIADIILVCKDGWINFRASIETYDTNGMVIKMFPNAGNVTDEDGNVYQSVRLGNQIWTIDNLKTTKYNDGTAIRLVVEHGVDNGTTGWRNLSIGAYCYFENDANSLDQSGALYNWYAVQTGKLAPEGWHVPADAEWDTLQYYLIVHGYNWDGTTRENKIAKSMAAAKGWPVRLIPGSPGNDPRTNNASGFSALPGSCRNKDGSFVNPSSGHWWSSTRDGTSAWNRSLDVDAAYLCRKLSNLQNGLSVRLLRN